MIEYLKGKVISLYPTHVILETNEIGYEVHISIQTYSAIDPTLLLTLFIHEVIREDAHQLFGFISTDERNLFRHLISVSGIGPNTARMMLSSLSSEEIKHAILSGNSLTLKNIKGIGSKTAERIIIDLKDKVGKISKESENLMVQSNTLMEEALSALLALGFNKQASEKTLAKISASESGLNLEMLIKKALKQL